MWVTIIARPGDLVLPAAPRKRIAVEKDDSVDLQRQYRVPVFICTAIATICSPFDDIWSAVTMAGSRQRPHSCTTWLTRASIIIVLAFPGVSASAQSASSDAAPPSVFGVPTHAVPPATLHDSIARAPLVDDTTEKGDRALTNNDRAFKIVVGSFFAAASSDLAVSMYQIGRGSARERGFGSWWQDSPVAFATSKTAMAAAFAYGLQRVHKTRPKTAFIMGLAATAVESLLVVRGARHPAVP